MKQCGVVIQPTKWLVVFEIPDSASNIIPSEDRIELRGDLKMFNFFEAFKKNIPQEMLDYINKQIVKNSDSQDISKWLKDQFSDLLPNRKEGNRIKILTHGNNPSSNKSSRNNNKPPQNKRSRLNGLQKLKNRMIPSHLLVNGGEDGPLVEFDYAGYSLTVNRENFLFQDRCKKISDKYENILKAETEDMVYKYTLKGALYRIFTISRFNDKFSLEERRDRWNIESLESAWTKDTETAIDRAFSSKNKNREGIIAA